MYKIKPGKITAETIINNFKGTTGRIAASDNAFSFMRSVKGTTAHSKQFSYNVLATV